MKALRSGFLYFKQSIIVKLAAALYIILLVPMLLMMWTTYSRIQTTTYSDFMESKQDVLYQMVQNMDRNFDNIIKKSNAPIFRLNSLRQFFNEGPSSDPQQADINSSVSNTLFDILISNDCYDFLGLLTLDGTRATISEWNRGNSFKEYDVNYSGLEWFQATIRLNGYPYMQDVDYLGKDNHAIIVTRTINDYDDANRAIGISMVGQGISKFADIVTTGAKFEGENELFYIISPASRILYASNNDLEQTAAMQGQLAGGGYQNGTLTEIAGQPYYVIRNEESAYGFTIISMFPQHAIEEKLGSLQGFFVSLIIMLLIGILIISVLSAFLFSKPVKRIVLGIRQIEQGHFGAVMEVKGKDELSQINHAINRVSVNLQHLLSEKVELTTMVKEMEIVSLTNKINPHFLYNTFSTLTALIDKGDLDASKQLVNDLSDYYRYSLERGDPVITFAQELENVKKYIGIQMLRYQGRVAVEYDIDPAALACKIPRMTLQPVVENTFTHGFLNKTDMGHIQIAAHVVGNILVAYISDDGEGIGDVELQRINRLLRQDTYEDREESKKHVGIFNVNDRVRLLFGSRYGLLLSSESGHGTTAKITLPCPGGGDAD